MEELVQNIEAAIMATHPVVYLCSDEEETVLKILYQKVKDYLLFFYDEAYGIRWMNEDNFKDITPLFLKVKNQIDGLDTNFCKTLSFVRDISKEEKTVFVVIGTENVFEGKQVNVRYLKNVISEIREGECKLTIFLVSNKLSIPDVIERDVLLYELDYPDRKEIINILEKFLSENEIFISGKLKGEFVSSLQGLTRVEINDVLYFALGKMLLFDENTLKVFFEYKTQLIQKNSILEYVSFQSLPDNVGGLKNLKAWLERKKKIFKNFDEAVQKGVDIPKGILLFGMPGCGKSLTAKYAAKLLGIPILRLDMGRIMGPYLGQSEENLRKAIKIAESIAPSILWIDEIEKAFAGVKGETEPTLTRIFGTLLTWMQEKTKTVFVIATANDLTGIPLEFLRKGRFDEIFFVDFPDKDSMKEIFRIHLIKRKGKENIENIDFDKIVNKLEYGYSGADIEAIVSEAVERSFLADKNVITTSDLIEVIQSGAIKPIKESLKEKVDNLREVFKKIDAKPAN